MLIGSKSWLIRLDKIGRFRFAIKVCDGTRELVLFGPEKYDVIWDRIR